MLPLSFRNFLRRSVPDAQERRGLRRFTAAVCAAVHARYPNRERWRSFRGTCMRLVSVYRLRRPPVPADGREGRDGPRAMSRDALVRWLAETGVHWMRRASTSPRRSAPAASIYDSETVRGALGILRSAVRCGVFWNVDRAVGIDEVWARMLALARTDPARFSFFRCAEPHRPSSASAHPPPTPEYEITEDDLARVLAWPPLSPRDRLMITVFYTTGLRREAVTGLRWDQLWDAAARSVRPAFTVPEKMSRRRTVRIVDATTGAPVSPLHAAVLAFAAALPPDGPDAPPPPVYCFESRRGEPPTSRTLYNRLARICESAGVPPFRPHAFRRFVVNHAMRRGATLPEVSAFIGHESTGVTYRYYWTEDVSTRVNAVLERPLGERLDELRAELRELERRIDATQREIDAWATTVTDRTLGDRPTMGSKFDAALRAAAATTTTA